MAKNEVPGLLRVSLIRRKKFFGLSFLAISAGYKVKSKIPPNQENRRSCSKSTQENTNFPHLGLKVPKLKFGSFFQNSYRSNDLTNSKRSDPNFFLDPAGLAAAHQKFGLRYMMQFKRQVPILFIFVFMWFYVRVYV